jgi:hypothetical protein
LKAVQLHILVSDSEEKEKGGGGEEGPGPGPLKLFCFAPKSSRRNKDLLGAKATVQMMRGEARKNKVKR